MATKNISNEDKGASSSKNNWKNDENDDDEYLCLVEFSHKHLDFLLPELLSVLEMNGIGIFNNDHDNADAQASTTTLEDNTKNDKDHKWRTMCRIIPLPNETSYQQETKAAPRRPFLILAFSSDYYWNRKRRQQKQQNKTQQETAENENKNKTTNNDDNDNLDDDPDIATVLSRCVLVRRVIELWGKPGTTIEETAHNTRQWIQGGLPCNNDDDGGELKDQQSASKQQQQAQAQQQNCTIGKSVFEKARDPSQSWKITVHTLGSKYTRQEQDTMRANFAFLDFPGPVKMKDFTHEFLLIRETELDPTGSPLYPRHGHLGKGNIIPEHDARRPLACYFGRILVTRETLEQYHLKRRAYLGPTSMDSELSFIMTNLGHVQKSSVVLDPFVGTGSILVSCALRGAYCVGTDIDIRVLRGRSKDENVYSNFAQFELPRPELVRSDNAIYHRHFRNAEPWVDAIITDPPYGIRAGARKSGSRLDEPRPVLEEHRHDHIAQTRPYDVGDVMADLLDVAARVLVMGGRLVYVIPSFATAFDPLEDLPRHECLERIHLSFQPFTPELGRRMVTMQKTKPYNPELRHEYLAKTWKNGPASAEKCANIRDKILEAAKKKPGYEEKARVRKQKRKEHKEAKKEAKKRVKLEHATMEQPEEI